MQFASAITEYVLPGLPVTAVLMYGIALVPGRPLDKVLLEPGWPMILGLLIPLLGVAYMLGVVIHYLARRVLLEWYADQETKTWERFGPYCETRLDLLGPTTQNELCTLPSDSLNPKESGIQRWLVRFFRSLMVGRPRNKKDDNVSGWILWRMRMYLCNYFPTSAQEVLHLQAVSRAARGALALPLALIAWALVDFTKLLGLIHDTSVTDWLLPVVLLLSGAALMRAVRCTYTYRWGVVCRSTVAAFLSTAKPSSLVPPLPRAAVPPPTAQ